MPKTAVSAASEEDEWQAESDLRTLIEAEKIRKDSKRLKAAMKKREEMQATLKNVKG